jgi:hypothetical protein
VVAGNSSTVDQMDQLRDVPPSPQGSHHLSGGQKLANWTQLPIVYQEDIQCVHLPGLHQVLTPFERTTFQSQC